MGNFNTCWLIYIIFLSGIFKPGKLGINYTKIANQIQLLLTDSSWEIENVLSTLMEGLMGKIDKKTKPEDTELEGVEWGERERELKNNLKEAAWCECETCDH